MTVISNKGVILKAIPIGMPKVDDFELVHRTIDIENLKLGENEIVLKNLYLSLDPYIRLTFEELGPAIYDTIVENKVRVGQIITGYGLSEVVKTNNSKYKVGDLVYATTINIGNTIFLTLLIDDNSC